MYAAVSVVQAHNSANALEVSEAMKQHAELGAEGLRQEEELELERQRENERQRQQDLQQQQQQNSSGNVGRAAYVAEGSGQASNGFRVGAAQEEVRLQSVYAVTVC